MSYSSWLVCLMLAGCSSAADERPDVESPEGPRERSSWSSATEEEGSLARAPSRTLVSPPALEEAGAARFRVTRITQPTPRPVRRGSGRLIDLELHRADIQNAIRFIADAGQMNVVVEDGVRGTVTIHLKRVRAHDALLAVVHAYGARLEERGNILIVRKRR